jgi:hypothetical protein
MLYYISSFAAFLKTISKCFLNVLPLMARNTQIKLSHCKKIIKYLLTPWNRVLEKLIGSQRVKKFPTFYGARRFIAAFTNALHLPLSRAR